MSIDYQNIKQRHFPNKYNLKNTYEDFYPQKTYSKGMHHNKKKLNLKKNNIISHIFSPLKNDNNNKTISSINQSNPISNNNTCYKTNGFSPRSTKTIFSQIKTIKEKSVRKKIKQNKKNLLSMKFIEFMNDNNLNDIKKHNYFKLIKKNNIVSNIIYEDNKQIPKNFNKETIKYIFIGDKNNLKNDKEQKINYKANEIINKLENNHKIYKNINSFSCPNVKLNDQHFKRNKKHSKNSINLEIHNLFFESSKENVSNFNEIESHSISTFRNIKKNKGLLYKMKNKNINYNMYIKNDDLSENNRLKDFMKNNDYILNSNIEMFDPITFIKNSSLFKDYLERKQKEKLLLKKFLKNKKPEEILSNINIYEPKKEMKHYKIVNKSSDLIKYKLEEQILNLYKKRLLNYIDNENHLTNNKLKIKDEDKYYKTYLKPSEYIHDVAKKILEDISFFRNKIYFGENNFKNNNHKLKSINKIKSHINEEKNHISNKNKNLFSEYSLNEITYKNFNKYNNKNINNNIDNNKINIRTKNNNYKTNEEFENKDIKNKEKEENNENKRKENYIHMEKEKKADHLNTNSKNNYLFEKNRNDYTNYNKQMISLTSNKRNDSEKQIIFERNEENILLFKKYSLSENLKNNENEGNIIMVTEPKIKNLKNNIIKEKIKKENEKEKGLYKKKEKEIYIKENTEEVKEKVSKEINKFIYSNLILKNENSKIKNLKKKNDNKNKINIDLYDKLYGFNKDDVGDDLLIIDELKRIDIDEDLKKKLIENRNNILKLINKNLMNEEDYKQLLFCKKRIKYIIKKLIEKTQKKNLIKSEKKNLLPKSLKGKKILYKYLRSLEFKIIKKFEKDNKMEQSLENESDDENSNLDEIKFFCFCDNKDNEDENHEKTKLEEENEKNKKKLIYDNLY